jgi:general secretion pathway protein H
MTNTRPLVTIKRQLQAGFTLLEVMVVVLIVGIIISFATLSIGPSASQQQEQESKRIVALVKLAGEEAILNASDIVLQLTERGYRFALLDAGGQVKPFDSEDTTYRPRELPDNLRLRATINGEEASLTQTYTDTEQLPSVFILSSGELTPFEIDVVDDDDLKFRAIGSYSGQVVYQGRVDD